MSFEFVFLDWIQSIRFGFLDTLMIIITTLGDFGWIWIGLAVVLTVNKKTRMLGVACVISLAFSAIFTNLGLKNIVGRERPYMFREVELLIAHQNDYSFPSGHTSAAFAVSYVLMKEKFSIKGFRVDIAALILASVMAFSRMYLYVHYPTDIIASLILAYVYSLVAIKLTKRFYKTDTLQEL